MLLKGKHIWQNALAALALGAAIHLPMEDSMLKTLRTFSGLPHCCQWVRRYQGVDWYNDSKATNVKSTNMALLSIGENVHKINKKNLILIAGGFSKQADFTPLRDSVYRYVLCVILIGEDTSEIVSALEDISHIHRAGTLEKAINFAAKIARMGDTVLLSPACASFDQFENAEARGNDFIKHVNALC